MNETNSRIGSRLRAGLVGGVSLLAVASLAVVGFVRAADNPKPAPVTLAVSETPVARQSDGKFTTSFAPIVKRVAQSVVQIDVMTKSKTAAAPQMPSGDDFMQRFFGGMPGMGQPGRTYQTPSQRGLGSGVIVTKDGYILTNNHVVDGADTIKVTLTDGREFTARVIGRDPKTDVAVVKIDAKDLPFITVADSDKIEVGDVCLAIGNPFGIGQTVTMGIISATGRANVDTGADYEDFLQTDAAINPGNSGGALVDTEGRLIGINTAILSRSGGNQGIGFAIPVDLARSVMDSLVTSGKVVRGYLGVGIQTITPALADQFKLHDDHGALVGDIVPNGPADKAGFKSGDVIVDFNNKTVTDSAHLRLQVAATAPGSDVPVKILRDGKAMTLNVTVKELPGSEQLAKSDESKSDANDALHGVTVADIDARTAHQLNLPANIKGAIVADVDQNSPAYDDGVRRGDVILEINRKPVHSADDAVKLTENLKNRKILLRLWSSGSNGGPSGSHYLVVDESKAG